MHHTDQYRTSSKTLHNYPSFVQTTTVLIIFRLIKQHISSHDLQSPHVVLSVETRAINPADIISS